MTREQQKQEALRRLKMLNLHENVINEFEKEDVVYYSENGGLLFWVSNEEWLTNLIKENEAKYKYLVYHVILTRCEYGTLITLLTVSNYKSEWKYEIENRHDEYGFNVFSHCGIQGDNYGWDMGDCCVREQIGGLVRTY